MEGMPATGDPKSLFGYRMPGTTIPFLVCTLGIFGCYCLSSMSQEYLYLQTNSEGEKFHYTSSLTLWCKLAAMLWGSVGGGLFGRKAPHRWHFCIGFLTFATMWLSNQSLLWLNYPTQTLFKSAKLLPVMAGGVLINRRKFHVFEYLSALGLLMGLVCFTLTDMRVAPRFDFLGVFVICLALLADALIGNFQEKMFATFHCGANEVMTYSSAWAALFSLVLCAVDGETVAGTKYIFTSSPLVTLSCAVYAGLNILGQMHAYMLPPTCFAS